jgi:hypothetical protein
MKPDAAADDIAKQRITPRHRQDRQSEDPCAEAARPNLHVMSKGRAYELERNIHVLIGMFIRHRLLS